MKIIKLVVLLKILYSLMFESKGNIKSIESIESPKSIKSQKSTNSLKIIKVTEIKNINLPWGGCI